MAPRPQHFIENDPARSPEVTTWNVEPGDVVVVRGVFTRAEVRAYAELVERVYPDAGLTVIFSPPGVDVERIARMAEGWQARPTDAKTEVHAG